ncbi:MAG: hypothetical protein Q8927_03235 [Bacteroidota bacterium]|nr:hypothetical protein [Bacteroidota bacterium]MDP4215188.1 hypothetical protein [Bacteroidota bacterium]MDP4244983.1 hypothetical protein [Bacteroidota bacterium]MDP4255457.1 hypothetical protein [Bacteroidota bacterium]MDP4256710.1 hypothetical protein [Bacteroidota bacterium]
MKQILLTFAGSLLINALSAQYWGSSGANIYNSNAGQVGIGTSSPDQLLTVNGVSHLGNDVNLTRTDGFASASFVVDNVTTQNIYFQKSGGGNIAGIYLNGNLVYCSGSLAIGTTNPYTYKLAVDGPAIFTQATVKLFASWPDFVFKRNYQLPSLKSVEEYIKSYHRLPGLPSADSVERNGLDLGNTEVKLLQKIEELTLYTIDLQKKIEKLEQTNKELQMTHQLLGSIQNQIDELKKAKE